MWISIDNKQAKTLMRQVYEQIKTLILTGKLTYLEKLPSTRSLAKELGLSRHTILDAYEQLISEGYLSGKHGSATYVAFDITKYQPLTSNIIKTPQSHSTALSKVRIDFRSGIPDLSYFPQAKWCKRYDQIVSGLPKTAFYYQSSAGLQSLRTEIANYLLRVRGLQENPENIMIVSGSTQGLSLISSLLYRPGKEVIIEDPTHPGLRRVIQMSGHELKEIKVDDLGLKTQLLEDSDCTSFLYTTPSHQYPLGGILPIQRRLNLIEYAKRNHCYIYEDDYDSEFRYSGAPVSALRELAPEQVIYSGSFSKILSPALRLGYLILPEVLITPYLTLKQYSDVHSEALTQYVLADLLQQGDLERYTLKMKKIYEKKRLHLLNELSAYFSDTFQIKGQAAGLHMILTFPNISFTKELCHQLQEKGIKIYPVSNYYTTATKESVHDVLLGYAHLEPHEISEGIRILWQGLN